MNTDQYLVNPATSLGSLEDEGLEVEERIPRPVLFMKIIELIFASGCLASYVAASTVEENASKVGLCWATFGSQVIVLTFVLAGYIIGETTPRLVVGHNALGGVLFLASGACTLDTWCTYQEAMLGVETDSQANWDADMLLVTGILALMNAAMLLSDTLVAAVLWKLSRQEHRSSSWH